MRNLPGNPGMSLEEIAQEMHMSKSAVNMCIHRALRKLRSQGLTFTCKELADDLDRNRKGSVQYEA
jgi:predicted DNA-binding protein YlxM (UPF0122 family)